MTAKDGRRYRQLFFEPVLDGDIITNMKPRSRNFFDKAPDLVGDGDPLYEKGTVGKQVAGHIHPNAETEPFFIPDPARGTDMNEDGELGRYVDTISLVVLHGETLEQSIRNSGRVPRGGTPRPAPVPYKRNVATESGEHEQGDEAETEKPAAKKQARKKAAVIED